MSKSNAILRAPQLSFAVYLVNALSAAWGMTSPKVYSLLKSSKALDDYIIPFYDVLHTCGERYLVEDITGYLKEQGYAVKADSYLAEDIVENEPELFSLPLSPVASAKAET